MSQEGFSAPYFPFHRSNEVYFCEAIAPSKASKGERWNKYTWRAQYSGELYAAFGKDESLLKREVY